MKNSWEFTIHLDNGSTKTFTDYDSAEQAEKAALEIAQKGFAQSDPNDYNAKTIYPAHRIQFINTNETKEADGKITITSPQYFEDDEPCGYCNREIGQPHHSSCRQ